MKNTAKKIIAAALAATTIFGTGLTTGSASLAKLSPLTITASAAVSPYEYSDNGDGTATIDKYTGSASTVSIPEKLGGLKVTAIGSEAFEGCKTIKKVNFSNSIETIGSNAFMNCDNIETITIPESVTTLGDGAFQEMDSLEKVIVNGAITEMGSSIYGVFRNCNSLESATFKSGTTIIGYDTFEGCESLKTVSLPSTVKVISDFAFENCKSLVNITLPSNLKEIGNSAFESCTSLPEIKIPDKVTKIDTEAFRNCTGSAALKIGSSVKIIGANAFCDCENIKTLTIPESVTTLDDGAFSNMDSLEKVTINGKITTMGSIFYGVFSDCTNLKTVIINEGTTVIGYYAFDNCTNLKTVHIPTTVKKSNIDENAFNNTNPNLTICCTSSTSGAKAYANEHNIKFSLCSGHSSTSSISAPTITLSNVASNGKIKVSWDAVSGATSYKVYRATSKNGTYKLMKTTTSTSYINTSAEAGKTYYYKVKAVSADGTTSKYSGYKSRTCDLAKPTNVNISNNSKGHPRVTWNKVNGAASYKVYRATSKNGTYKLIKTTASTSFTNTSATAGTTYYYKVKAVCSNSAADSAYSTVVSVKAK